MNDDIRHEMEKDNHPCEIRIDRNGVWYFRGAEMFRTDIVRLFYENLKKDGTGRYLIEMGSERCYLDVEDTPFVVTSIRRKRPEKDGEERVVLRLIDGTDEILDPTTLRIGKDNVLYCAIRNGDHSARFSRASYYEMAAAFDYDPERDRFFFPLNGRNYDIHGQTSMATGNDGGESC